MTSDQECPIWGTPAKIERESKADLWLLSVHSPRAAADYLIHETVKDGALAGLDDPAKLRLTTWLVDQRRLGNPVPHINSEIVELVKRRRSLAVHERADRLLRLFQTRVRTIGDIIKIPNNGIDDEMLAWSESLKKSEVTYLIEYLVKVGLLEKGPATLASSEFAITPAGYAHLAELETKAIDSQQAFVAMWFDSSMDAAYKGIELGIMDAGYKPIRIDRKDHNNKIDDEIIAEIRRSRFLVADFTQGDRVRAEACTTKQVSPMA